MCGRYTLTSPVEAIGALFRVDARLNLGARYNIAPSQPIPIIRMNGDERELAAVTWGLIPSWMKERPVGRPMINARSETVAEKPSFRSAFKRRRCLIPTNGFYEWQQQPRAKRPHHIYVGAGDLFAFAGLWESWTDPKTEDEVETATIITQAACKKIEHIHDRMPVMLALSDYALWLEGGESGPELLGQIAQIPEADISFFEISTRVNSVANNDVSILEPYRR